MRKWIDGVCVVGFCLAAGCGGSTAIEPTVPEGDKASAVEMFGLTGPDAPWNELSHSDKEFYMIGKVNPIFQEMFARHDAEEYNNFSCEACHGEEMRELEFKMPAPSMYIVPPEGTPGYKGMEITFPETVAFMRDSVTPAMGKLLGMETEVTCATCHPSEAPKKVASKKRSKRRRK